MAVKAIARRRDFPPGKCFRDRLIRDGAASFIAAGSEAVNHRTNLEANYHMKSEYYIDDVRNMVVLTRVGNISVNDDVAIHKVVLADPKFKKGMNSLIDMTEATYDWGLQEMDQFRTYINALARQMGERKWALVSNGGITQANVKLFTVLHDLQPHGLTIKLFSSKFEAIKWLSSSE